MLIIIILKNFLLGTYAEKTVALEKNCHILPGSFFSSFYLLFILKKTNKS